MVLVTQWGQSFYSILLLFWYEPQPFRIHNVDNTQPYQPGGSYYYQWTSQLRIESIRYSTSNQKDILYTSLVLYLQEFPFPKPGLGKRAQPTFRAVQLTVFCVYVCVFISHLLPLTECWCDCSFRRLQLPQVKLLSCFFLYLLVLAYYFSVIHQMWYNFVSEIQKTVYM